MSGRQPYRGSGAGSHHYTSRPRSNRLLRGIVTVLIVILLLLALTLFLLQDYMVYSDNGVRFDLPWLQEESPAPSVSSPLITGVIKTSP